MGTQKGQLDVNPTTALTLSRLSTWILIGTCVALALFISQYHRLSELFGSELTTLSLLLLLFSLAFGVAQNFAALRFDRQSKILSPNNEMLESLITVQLLLTLFQSLLLTCVILLLSFDVAVAFI